MKRTLSTAGSSRTPSAAPVSRTGSSSKQLPSASSSSLSARKGVRGGGHETNRDITATNDSSKREIAAGGGGVEGDHDDHDGGGYASSSAASSDGYVEDTLRRQIAAMREQLARTARSNRQLEDAVSEAEVNAAAMSTAAAAAAATAATPARRSSLISNSSGRGGPTTTSRLASHRLLNAMAEEVASGNMDPLQYLRSISNATRDDAEADDGAAFDVIHTNGGGRRRGSAAEQPYPRATRHDKTPPPAASSIGDGGASGTYPSEQNAAASVSAKDHADGIVMGDGMAAAPSTTSTSIVDVHALLSDLRAKRVVSTSSSYAGGYGGGDGDGGYVDNTRRPPAASTVAATAHRRLSNASAASTSSAAFEQRPGGWAPSQAAVGGGGGGNTHDELDDGDLITTMNNSALALGPSSTPPSGPTLHSPLSTGRSRVSKGGEAATPIRGGMDGGHSLHSPPAATTSATPRPRTPTAAVGMGRGSRAHVDPFSLTPLDGNNHYPYHDRGPVAPPRTPPLGPTNPSVTPTILGGADTAALRTDSAYNDVSYAVLGHDAVSMAMPGGGGGRGGVRTPSRGASTATTTLDRTPFVIPLQQHTTLSGLDLHSSAIDDGHAASAIGADDLTPIPKRGRENTYKYKEDKEVPPSSSLQALANGAAVEFTPSRRSDVAGSALVSRRDSAVASTASGGAAVGGGGGNGHNNHQHSHQRPSERGVSASASSVVAMGMAAIAASKDRERSVDVQRRLRDIDSVLSEHGIAPYRPPAGIGGGASSTAAQPQRRAQSRGASPSTLGLGATYASTVVTAANSRRPSPSVPREDAYGAVAEGYRGDRQHSSYHNAGGGERGAFINRGGGGGGTTTVTAGGGKYYYPSHSGVSLVSRPDGHDDEGDVDGTVATPSRRGPSAHHTNQSQSYLYNAPANPHSNRRGGSPRRSVTVNTLDTDVAASGVGAGTGSINSATSVNTGSYLPPTAFLPDAFVKEYGDVLTIIDKYSALYHRQRAGAGGGGSGVGSMGSPSRGVSSAPAANTRSDASQLRKASTIATAERGGSEEEEEDGAGAANNTINHNASTPSPSSQQQAAPPTTATPLFGQTAEQRAVLRSNIAAESALSQAHMMQRRCEGLEEALRAKEAHIAAQQAAVDTMRHQLALLAEGDEAKAQAVDEMIAAELASRAAAREAFEEALFDKDRRIATLHGEVEYLHKALHTAQEHVALAVSASAVSGALALEVMQKSPTKKRRSNAAMGHATSSSGGGRRSTSGGRARPHHHAHAAIGDDADSDTPVLADEADIMDDDGAIDDTDDNGCGDYDDDEEDAHATVSSPHYSVRPPPQPKGILRNASSSSASTALPHTPHRGHTPSYDSHASPSRRDSIAEMVQREVARALGGRDGAMGRQGGDGGSSAAPAPPHHQHHHVTFSGRDDDSDAVAAAYGLTPTAAAGVRQQQQQQQQQQHGGGGGASSGGGSVDNSVSIAPGGPLIDFTPPRGGVVGAGVGGGGAQQQQQHQQHHTDRHPSRYTHYNNHNHHQHYGTAARGSDAAGLNESAAQSDDDDDDGAVVIRSDATWPHAIRVLPSGGGGTGSGGGGGNSSSLAGGFGLSPRSADIRRGGGGGGGEDSPYGRLALSSERLSPQRRQPLNATAFDPMASPILAPDQHSQHHYYGAHQQRHAAADDDNTADFVMTPLGLRRARRGEDRTLGGYRGGHDGGDGRRVGIAAADNGRIESGGVPPPLHLQPSTTGRYLHEIGRLAEASAAASGLGGITVGDVVVAPLPPSDAYGSPSPPRATALFAASSPPMGPHNHYPSSTPTSISTAAAANTANNAHTMSPQQLYAHELAVQKSLLQQLARSKRQHELGVAESLGRSNSSLLQMMGGGGGGDAAGGGIMRGGSAANANPHQYRSSPYRSGSVVGSSNNTPRGVGGVRGGSPMMIHSVPFANVPPSHSTVPSPFQHQQQLMGQQLADEAQRQAEEFHRQNHYSAASPTAPPAAYPAAVGGGGGRVAATMMTPRGPALTAEQQLLQRVNSARRAMPMTASPPPSSSSAGPPQQHHHHQMHASSHHMAPLPGYASPLVGVRQQQQQQMGGGRGVSPSGGLGMGWGQQQPYLNNTIISPTSVAAAAAAAAGVRAGTPIRAPLPATATSPRGLPPRILADYSDYTSTMRGLQEGTGINLGDVSHRV